MADAATRLAGPVGLGTSAATIYTVPGATTAILRSLHVANTSAADRTFRLSIGTDGSGKRLFYDQPVPLGQSFDWSGFIVLAAAEIIQAYGDVAGLDITLSGVLVT
jgi:hypothetical protein